jgi:hypothetical protein
LKEECISKYGLVNDEMRRKIWPLLLNLDVLNKEEETRGSSQLN